MITGDRRVRFHLSSARSAPHAPAQGAGLAFNLSALLLNYLVYRSKLVPRWLSAWGFEVGTHAPAGPTGRCASDDPSTSTFPLMTKVAALAAYAGTLSSVVVIERDLAWVLLELALSLALVGIGIRNITSAHSRWRVPG